MTNENDNMTNDNEMNEILIERMADILTRTANAAHGTSPENGWPDRPFVHLHSWHNLPELVEQLRKERDEARAALASRHLLLADPVEIFQRREPTE